MQRLVLQLPLGDVALDGAGEDVRDGLQEVRGVVGQRTAVARAGGEHAEHALAAADGHGRPEGGDDSRLGRRQVVRCGQEVGVAGEVDADAGDTAQEAVGRVELQHLHDVDVERRGHHARRRLQQLGEVADRVEREQPEPRHGGLLRGAGLEVLLGRPAGADVAGRRLDLDHRAAVVADRAGRRLHPHVAARGAPHAVGRGQRAPRGGDGLRRAREVQVLRVDEVVRAAPDERRGLVAEHLPGGRRDVAVDAVRVVPRDDVRVVLRQQPVGRLAPRELAGASPHERSQAQAPRRGRPGQQQRQRGADAHDAQPVAALVRRGLLVEEAVVERALREAQLVQRRSHLAVARAVERAHRHDVGQHVLPQRAGLGQERVAAADPVRRAIAREQDVGQLVGVAQRVLPAEQHRTAHSLGAVAVVGQLLLGGEQRVAVEVDAVHRRREHQRLASEGPQLGPRARGEQPDGVEAPRRELAGAVAVGHPLEPVEVDAGALQHGQERRVHRRVVDPHSAPHEVARVADAAVRPHDEGVVRVLEDRREHDEGRSLEAPVDEVRRGYRRTARGRRRPPPSPGRPRSRRGARRRGPRRRRSPSPGPRRIPRPGSGRGTAPAARRARGRRPPPRPAPAARARATPPRWPQRPARCAPTDAIRPNSRRPLD